MQAARILLRIHKGWSHDPLPQRHHEREGAEIGLLITREELSKPMLLEASTAGVYISPISGKDYPRIQILSVRELLEERRRPMLPLLLMPTYQQAERITDKEAAEQKELFA